ncbi:MarR family transcriptional regulator [Candidatus Micrarchaeota archaeon]|nr:MarR family transcriptional regulator [Candidatus Micrarchaeota archaeon]
MQKVFLRIKPCRMMVLLKESGSKYISELAKESGATYVHATKLIRHLEKEGIVTIEQNGKKRMVKLTEKGMKIATALSEATNSFTAV